MAVSEHDPDGDGFVGRTEERAVVAGLVEAAAAGQPWVVWVEGDAGSGKTALVRRAMAALPASCSSPFGAALKEVE
jgi:ABC-type molybdenum transport system ATPase subunit/photorepair protein PhrA